MNRSAILASLALIPVIAVDDVRPELGCYGVPIIQPLTQNPCLIGNDLLTKDGVPDPTTKTRSCSR